MELYWGRWREEVLEIDGGTGGTRGMCEMHVYERDRFVGNGGTGSTMSTLRTWEVDYERTVVWHGTDWGRIRRMILHSHNERQREMELERGMVTLGLQ